MAIPVHLQIDATAGGGWRLALGHRDEPRARARLDAARVHRLRADLTRALDLERLPVLLVPGRDADITTREEQAGRALAAVLTATPGLAAAFGRARGLAQARGEPLILALDADDPTVRALPWELLASDADESPMEANGQAIVVRLGRGGLGRATTPASSIATRWWAPDPTESVAAALVRHLEGLSTQHGGSAAAPAGERIVDGQALILHLISHGRRSRDVLALLNDAGHGAGTAIHILQPVLKRADLVVVSICEGADATALPLDDLPDRVIAAGARACVAARGPLGLDAARAFNSGLYAALADARPLVEAIAAGRRSVRALALPFPDARWYQLTCTLPALDDTAGPMIQRVDRPAGWPMPDADAAALLQTAYEHARQAGSGYVGVEHLALALIDGPPVTELARLRFQLGARRRNVEGLLGAFAPRVAEAMAPQPTPRLLALGSRLPARFDRKALWDALVIDAEPTLRVLLDDLERPVVRPVRPGFDEETEGSGAPGTPLGPALALEVVAGPEDGRILTIAPNETVGRASRTSQATHALYADTRLTDSTLSRTHLRWAGPGAIELRAGSHYPPRTPGVFPLEAGEVIGLTRCTWLRGLTASQVLARRARP
ncbi:MAG: CHAT domain-containing protein [Myxococcales bacterium]|nr:CHAT domain-containing protein [Myxococcales bacterium]